MSTASTNISLAGVVAYLIGIINSIIPVLAALAILLFMWGVFKYIYSASSGKKQNREFMKWGLAALFVLFSIWGILRFACDSFLSINLCSSGTGQTVNTVYSPGSSTQMPTFDANFGSGVGQVPPPTPGRPTFVPQ